MKTAIIIIILALIATPVFAGYFERITRPVAVISETDGSPVKHEVYKYTDEETDCYIAVTPHQLNAIAISCVK